MPSQTLTGTTLDRTVPGGRAPHAFLSLGPFTCLRLYAQGRRDGSRDVLWGVEGAGRARGAERGAEWDGTRGTGRRAEWGAERGAEQNAPFVERELERSRQFCANCQLRLEEAVGAHRVELAFLEKQREHLTQDIEDQEQNLQRRRAGFTADAAAATSRGPGEARLDEGIVQSRRLATFERSLAPLNARIDEAREQVVLTQTRIDKLAALIEQAETHARYLQQRHSQRTALRIAAYNQAATTSRLRQESKISAVQRTDERVSQPTERAGTGLFQAPRHEEERAHHEYASQT